MRNIFSYTLDTKRLRFPDTLFVCRCILLYTGVYVPCTTFVLPCATSGTRILLFRSQGLHLGRRLFWRCSQLCRKNKISSRIYYNMPVYIRVETSMFNNALLHASLPHSWVLYLLALFRATISIDFYNRTCFVFNSICHIFAKYSLSVRYTLCIYACVRLLKVDSFQFSSAEIERVRRFRCEEYLRGKFASFPGTSTRKDGSPKCCYWFFRLVGRWWMF